jgi:hypothetical protein
MIDAPEGAKRNGYDGVGWFWKPATLALFGALSSALVGMIGFIFVNIFQPSAITRAEARTIAREIVRTQAPYIEDRKMLIEYMKKTDRQFDRMNSSIDAIKENLYGLKQP